MRQAFVALLMLASLMAGCSDPSSAGTDAEDEPEAFDEVEVTDTTGAIRGVVVTEAIVPLEGSLVQISGGPNRTTDKDGAFVFNGLEPGDYVLLASYPHRKSIQTTVTVVAGVEPDITKFMLPADPTFQPYAEMQQWTGFLGCGFGTNFAGIDNPVTSGASVNPCAVDATLCTFANICLLNTANTHEFPFSEAGNVPDHAQGEMYWEGTQAFGEGLNLGWHDSGTSDFKSISGESPLILRTNHTEIAAAKEDMANLTNLMMRVFPGTGTELTVTLQQKFDIYVTYFYMFEPRKDWTFSVDGACTPYDRCL